MAQILVCDVCQSPKSVTTQTFTLAQKTYEVDLCDKDRDALEKALSPYMGREVKGPGRAAPKSGMPTYKASDIRAWAASEGIDVDPRGRIKTEVRDLYHVHMLSQG